MQTFTKQYMIDNCGCYSTEELLACSFMNFPELTLKSIFESEIPLKDKFWFFCKKVATKEQNQQVSIAVAEIVLPIYEKRYPNNKSVRECIEVAKQYIAGHVSLEILLEKRRYAYAAAAAADDAAAAAAAYAAVAAAAADVAAAADDAAAAAAAYAAVAAAAVAAYAAIKRKLQDILMTHL